MYQINFSIFHSHVRLKIILLVLSGPMDSSVTTVSVDAFESTDDWLIADWKFDLLVARARAMGAAWGSGQALSLQSCLSSRLL